MEVQSKRFLLLQISGNCTENYSEIPWLNDKLRHTFCCPQADMLTLNVHVRYTFMDPILV